MPEAVIVTVRYEGREQDYSLPLQIPVEQWLSALAKALGAGEDAALCHEGKALDRSSSLAACHVWDGSLLTIERR